MMMMNDEEKQGQSRKPHPSIPGKEREDTMPIKWEQG